MSFKIVLSDIDGTFLTDDKKVTELTALAANKIIENGLKFVLVSARMPEAIYPITNAIGLPKIPLICYSGAYVLTDDEEVLHDKKMPEADTVEILKAMKNWQDISVNYYSGRKWYVEAINRRIQREIDITQAHAEIADFDSLIDKKIIPHKIMVICEPATCTDMEQKLQVFSELNVVRSAPHLLEIMDKSVSKAVGIEILLSHYNLTVDDAIAFGDNYNDIQMLELIPHSVAMNNAPDDIKKTAHAVTESNNNSGIYTYLNKLGLI
jgi:Cof subfamily protein (haloacid dehalogenase superfamily)